MGSAVMAVSSGRSGEYSILLAPLGNGRSVFSATAAYCTLVALACAGAIVMNTFSACVPLFSDIIRDVGFSALEVNGATYFCQPPAASALSTASAACATGSGDVKIVVTALAKVSLAPATRGSRLVSSAPLSAFSAFCDLSAFSDFSGSDFEHPPTSIARQENANIRLCDLPRFVLPNRLSPTMINSSVRYGYS